MSTHLGNISSCSGSGVNLHAVELVLEFAPNTLLDIDWQVKVYIFGSYKPATKYEPAEDAELDFVEICAVDLYFEDGSIIPATSNQIEQLELFRPNEDELYWNIAR
jgi:hypothetical protein